MTTLLICCFCHKRVSPASHVLVRSRPAHQACGDGWYAQLDRMTDQRKEL